MATSSAAISNVATGGEARARAATVYPDNVRVPATAAVAWGAILAGAAGAAALSLILLILGTGLGLSSVSPWTHNGISATTFGVSTILWLALTQLLASGLGGYLAGRLRTKWSDADRNEVYFRDTAHGFLAWAVASLATAAVLTSVIGSIVGGGIQAGATVAGGAATTAVTATAGAAAAAASETAKSGGGSGPMGYLLDSLFRKERSSATTSSSAAGATSRSEDAQSTAAVIVLPEVARIFMNSVNTGALPAEDVRYVGQLVAQRSALSQEQAEKRVSDTYGRLQEKLREADTAAKAAADKTRKASAYAALWLFVSLLIGAFVASLAATYGGRRRDA